MTILRPFPRALGLLLASIVTGPTIVRADVERIETDVGVYEVVAVTMKPTAFEFNQSRDAGVRVSAPGKLEGFRITEPAAALGQLSIPANVNWCVIGEQLFVGLSGEIQICSVPDLKEVSRRKLGEVRQQAANLQATSQQVLRVPGGWYCDGSIFDNSGEKLRCLVYPRHHLHRQKIQLRAYAETSLEGWPLNVTLQSGGITLTGFHPHHDIADQITSSSLGTLPQGQPELMRTNGDNCTFFPGSGSQTGIHLRIIRFDSETAGLPASTRMSYDQPTFNLSDLKVDSPHSFIDGPPQPVVVSLSDALTGNEPQKFARFDVNSAAARVVHAVLQQGPQKDYDRAVLLLKQHIKEITPEFQRTMGRAPEGLPLAVRVLVNSTWPDRSNEALLYYVWTEVPIDSALDPLFEQERKAKASAGLLAAEKAHSAAVDRQASRVRVTASGLLVVMGVAGWVMIVRYNRRHPLPEPVRPARSRKASKMVKRANGTRNIDQRSGRRRDDPSEVDDDEIADLDDLLEE